MRFLFITLVGLLSSTSILAQQKPQKAKPEKEVIASYQDGLAIVKRIKPVKWKKKPQTVKKVSIQIDSNGEEQYRIKEEVLTDDKIHIGINAEDIQAFAPDLVTSYINEEGEKALSVEYSALVYLLINAVKEQQAVIEELQGLFNSKKTK